MSTAQPALPFERMVFRNTNRYKGRHVSVTPGNSTNKHLSYGRIILDAGTRTVAFDNGNQETGLICLSGQATVRVSQNSFDLGQYDSIYIPRDSHIQISTDLQVDFAEFSSDVENQYPLQFIRYAEIAKDPSLKFSTGTPGQSRHLNICLGKNVKAGRLLVGFTFSEPGNWTSWPPHEHAAMLEEMYVYFNMPAPAFGLQMVYNNTEYPELVVPVRDGDAVLMPAGYHPNVSVPGHSIGFLWAMAAHREEQDRQFGVVNVQPAFSTNGSGLEASRK
ncbi:MAG TPA: 5-deoxy-glucuronate isomerase [Candidatus Angelobacter sp.]|nr:5-deoxy-glucuronate isomerase [Candidatus Angelobacter sp.]